MVVQTSDRLNSTGFYLLTWVVLKANRLKVALIALQVLSGARVTLSQRSLALNKIKSLGSS